MISTKSAISCEIEHIVYKCRQYGVKNVFLSGLKITNRLPEQLVKEFNMSIRNTCSRTPDCDYIGNGNIALNEVCSDSLHLSGKGKYVLISNYLDKVLIFFRSSSVPTEVHTQGMKAMFCRTIYKYWKMQY